MKPSEVLRAARAKIDTPEKWMRGAYARVGEHAIRSAFTIPPNADSYCSIGACFSACNSAGDFRNAHRAINQLSLVIGRPIDSWNDAPERTHAEVLAAFDAAIVRAEAEGQ